MLVLILCIDGLGKRYKRFYLRKCFCTYLKLYYNRFIFFGLKYEYLYFIV